MHLGQETVLRATSAILVLHSTKTCLLPLPLIILLCAILKASQNTLFSPYNYILVTILQVETLSIHPTSKLLL